MKILHRDEVYAAVEHGAGPAIVTFQSWMKDPGLDRNGYFAEAFLVREGFRFIGIKAERNDWYQHPNLDRALEAVERAMEGERPIVYGSSMGGHAAWAFSGALNARYFVAAEPQYTVRRTVVPWETRWATEEQYIDTHVGWRPPPAKTTPGYIIYDPDMESDRRHVELIDAAGAGIVQLKYPGSGHGCLGAIHNTGQLVPLIQRLLRTPPGGE